MILPKPLTKYQMIQSKLARKSIKDFFQSVNFQTMYSQSGHFQTMHTKNTLPSLIKTSVTCYQGDIIRMIIVIEAYIIFLPTLLALFKLDKSKNNANLNFFLNPKSKFVQFISSHNEYCLCFFVTMYYSLASFLITMRSFQRSHPIRVGSQFITHLFFAGWSPKS